MAETLRDLVVSLSLNSDNFTRNIKSVNKQIQEAESEFKLASAGIENFEKTEEGLAGKLGNLNKKLKLQNDAIGQYRKALTEAQKKLKESYATQKEYEEKLVEAQKTYGANSKEVEKLAGQVTALQKATQNAADGVSKAQTNLNEAEAELKEIEAEIQKTSKLLQETTSKWTAAAKGFESFAQKCEKAGKTFDTIGKTLTATLTTSLTALGAAAVKASVDFEESFASVKKTVNATEEELEQLAKASKQMSTEVATGTDEINEVMATGGQLGIANEYLESFTRTMIDLGNACEDLSATEAATTIAQFANIMGTEQSQFENIGSTIVELGNNFATTEAPIMEMAKRLASAGKQVGLSEAQILGFAAALSSVGIEAESGGTTFSKALIKMEVACVEGGEALEDFATVSGMSADAFKTLWENDPAAAFQAFIEGLAGLDDEGESAIAVLDEIGISEVRLRDTLLRSVNATELFSNAQEMAQSAWDENNALTEEANKRYATTESKLKNLKNKVSLLGQAFGDDLNPKLQELISWASGVVDKLSEMDSAQRLQIVNIAGIAAAAGPVITVMGKVTTAVGKISGKLAAFSTAVAGAGGGLKGLLTVLTSSKLAVAAMTVAIGAGIVKLVQYATGVTAAKEAIEGLQTASDNWANSQADTFYASGEGLYSFNVADEDFSFDSIEGFAKIADEMEAEEARLAALGESTGLDAYENAVLALAQGWKEANEQLTLYYKEHHKNGEEGDAYVSSMGMTWNEGVDQTYLDKRNEALQAYAESLSEMVGKVYQSEEMSATIGQMESLYDLLAQYDSLKKSGDESGANSILGEINTLVSEMDEGKLADFVLLMSQIQSLVADGLSEEQVKSLFPEVDFTGALAQYQNIYEFLKSYKETDGMGELYSMFGESIMEEVLPLAVELDFNKADEQLKDYEDGKTVTLAVGTESGESGTETPKLTVQTTEMRNLTYKRGNVLGIVNDSAIEAIEKYINALQTLEGMDISVMDKIESLGVLLGNREFDQTFTGNVAEFLLSVIDVIKEGGTVSEEELATYEKVLAFVASLSQHGVGAEILGGIEMGLAEGGFETGGDTLGDALAGVIGKSLEEVSGSNEVKQAAADAATAVTEEIEGEMDLNWDKLSEIGQNIYGKIAEGFQTASNAAGEFLRPIWEQFKKAFEELLSGESLGLDALHVTDGLDPMEAIGSAFSGTYSLSGLLSGLWTEEETEAVHSEAVAVGENVVAGICEGEENGKGQIDQTSEELADYIGGAMNRTLEIKSPSKKMYPVGENVVLGIAAGMEGTSIGGTVQTVAGKMISAASTAASWDKFKSIGTNAMAGWKNGIESGKADVVSAICEAAREAVAAAQDELIIESPSKVFRDEVGVMVMKGFSEGIELESKNTVKKMENASRYLVGAAKDGSGISGSQTVKNYNSQSSISFEGANFYMSDAQDIRSLAIEIASLTKRNQAGRGVKAL